MAHPKLNFIPMWLLLGITLTPEFHAQAEVIQSKKLYESIQRVAEKIHQEYPPSEYVVVGIGRSPTPITAYLEGKYPGNIWSVPLSRFRYGIQKGKSIARNDTGLSDSNKEILFKHLDKFFPSQEEVGKRKILLLDYSKTGDSIVSAKKYFEMYLREKNRENEVHSFVIIRKSNEAVIRRKYSNQPNWVLEVLPEGDALGTQLAKAAYDDLSKYPSFDIESKPLPVIDKEGSLAYKDLIREIQEFPNRTEPVGGDDPCPSPPDEPIETEKMIHDLGQVKRKIDQVEEPNSPTTSPKKRKPLPQPWAF